MGIGGAPGTSSHASPPIGSFTSLGMREWNRGGGADHEGHDALAEHVIGLRDDRDVGHRRMGPQDGLDLDARYVDAAATHDVLLAIDEEEVAVGIEVAEITGEKPS